MQEFMETPIKRSTYKRVEQLEAYVSEHGCLPNTKMGEEARSLYRWMMNTIYRVQAGKELPEDIKQRMVDLGVVFEGRTPRNAKLEELWNTRFNELTAFYEAHQRVPRISDPEKVLFDWLVMQKRMWNKGTIRSDRAERIRNAEWGIWLYNSKRKNVFLDNNTDSWAENLKALKKYISQNGAAPTEKDNPELAKWVLIQKNLLQSRKISPTRRTAFLSALHQEQDHDAKWVARLRELRSYMVELQQLPSRNASDLYFWLRRQKTAIQSGTCEQWKIKRLLAIGFSLDGTTLLQPDFSCLHLTSREAGSLRKTWNKRLDDTVTAVRMTGNLPDRSYGILYDWVKRQEVLIESGDLEDWQEAALDKENLLPMLIERTAGCRRADMVWRNMCNRLKIVIASAGTSKHGLPLWATRWLDQQNRSMDEKSMADWQIKALLDAGAELRYILCFDPNRDTASQGSKSNVVQYPEATACQRNIRWNEAMNQLAAFLDEFHDMPTSTTNKQLAEWFYRQNQKMKRGRLENWQISRFLDSSFKLSAKFVI